MKNIFDKQEVLISCSSLNSFKISEFSINDDVAIKIKIENREFNKLIRIIKNDISLSSLNLSNTIFQKYFKGKKTDINQIITEILLARRYRGGKRELRNPKLLYKKIKVKTDKNEPIELSISLYPCKIPNVLKTAGPLPDLADLISIARFIEIAMSIKNVYAPGAKIIILTDGNRFKDMLSFPKADIDGYQKKIKFFIEILDGNKHIVFEDYMNLIKNKLGSQYEVKKNKLFIKIKNEYVKIFSSKISAEDISKHMQNLARASNKNYELCQKFLNLYNSLIFSTYIKKLDLKDKKSKNTLCIKVYEDIFNFLDINRSIVQIRKKIVEDTWEQTIDYISEITTGRILKPVEELYPESIRCDMHNISDRLTLYAVNRSTKLTSFHGTGYIDQNGHMSVALRILLDNQYVPIFGNFLGLNYEDQPFFYIHSDLIKNTKQLPFEKFHIK